MLIPLLKAKPADVHIGILERRNQFGDGMQTLVGADKMIVQRAPHEGRTQQQAKHEEAKTIHGHSSGEVDGED